MKMNRYNENDVVMVFFERGEEIPVKLGKPRKLMNEGCFVDWSYDSKTNGVNWISECWIQYLIEKGDSEEGYNPYLLSGDELLRTEEHRKSSY